MKALALALFLLPAALSAQTNDAPPNLHLAGVHLEKAGKQRSAAMSVALVGAGLGTVLIVKADGDDTMSSVGLGLMGTSCLISIGLNFGASHHEKEAGRLIQ